MRVLYQSQNLSGVRTNCSIGRKYVNKEEIHEEEEQTKLCLTKVVLNITKGSEHNAKPIFADIEIYAKPFKL